VLRKRHLFWFILLALVMVAGVVSAKEVPKPWESIDFGGATLDIVTRWENLTPLGPRGAYLWSNPDERLQAHIQKVEEMFNVKLNIKIGGGADIVRQDALTGDRRMDAFHNYSREVAKFANEGVIIPLDEYLDDEWWEQVPPELRSVREGLTIGGKLYAFASPHQLLDSPVAILWNQPLFEELGLPNLYEVFEAGEWTWETFHEIARKATMDTDGDGIIDRFGFTMDEARILRGWPLSNGFNWNTPDGKVNLLDPGLVETVDFLQELYQEGLIGTPAEIKDRVMVGLGLAHELMNNPAYSEAGFGLMPPPKGPRMEEYVSVNEGTIWGGLIPVMHKYNPRDIIEVMSALWVVTEPYIVYMDVYEDMEDWSNQYWESRAYYCPDVETFEMWQWLDRNKQPTFSPVVDAIENRVGLRATLVNRVIKGGESATSVLAELQPVWDAAFEEFRGLFE